MPNLKKLIAVFEAARLLLDIPGNDFIWSFWNDREDALREIDGVLAGLRSGALPEDMHLRMFFAPTGPIQEVSLSSGWGSEFLVLAERFDEAMVGDDADDVVAGHHPGAGASCACGVNPGDRLETARELGMDDRFAEATLLVCGNCGRHWLRYFYEVEGFSGSGRWYLGAVTPEQAAVLTAERAKDMLEGLEWYYYGGSYYGGRGGRASGKIMLSP